METSLGRYFLKQQNNGQRSQKAPIRHLLTELTVAFFTNPPVCVEKVAHRPFVILFFGQMDSHMLSLFNIKGKKGF